MDKARENAQRNLLPRGGWLRICYCLHTARCLCNYLCTPHRGVSLLRSALAQNLSLGSCAVPYRNRICHWRSMEAGSTTMVSSSLHSRHSALLVWCRCRRVTTVYDSQPSKAHSLDETMTLRVISPPPEPPNSPHQDTTPPHPCAHPAASSRRSASPAPSPHSPQ
jgi:hypothetical protein